MAKHDDHLPLYRQEEIYARSGVHIARSSMAQWIGICGVRLAPLAQALKQFVLGQRVVADDPGGVAQERTLEPVDDLFERPSHPYTRALLTEIPRIDQRHTTFNTIRGEIPSAIDPPSGCHFHPRCPQAFDRCRTEVPTLRGIAIHHASACHLNDAA